MRKKKKNTSRTCCSSFRRKNESCRKNREGKHKEQDEVHVVCVRGFFAKFLHWISNMSSYIYPFLILFLIIIFSIDATATTRDHCRAHCQSKNAPIQKRFQQSKIHIYTVWLVEKQRPGVSYESSDYR